MITTLDTVSPSCEGPLGLPRNYPPVFLNYPLDPKLIETPGIGKSAERLSW